MHNALEIVEITDDLEVIVLYKPNYLKYILKYVNIKRICSNCIDQRSNKQ